MKGISKDAADLFTVDLGSVGGIKGWFKQISNKKISVDPYSIWKALELVMKECEIRSVSGARLLWNDYRIFLSSADYERLRPLEAKMCKDVLKYMKDQVHADGIELEGPLKIEFFIDQEDDLPQGTARVRVAFNAKVVATSDPDVTRRFELETPVEVTERINDLNGNTLQLFWLGGDAEVREGERVVLGRPHEAPQGSFIELVGATSRISRRHVSIEFSDGAAIIGRLPESNPVQVNGRLIQVGGSISVMEFPIEISLSSGELIIKVSK